MLESRAGKDSHAAALFGILTPIVDDVTPLLELIRHSFPGYPKHGIDHSLRILERIGGILSKTALNSLSTNELFCLILAAVFHDAGMVAPDSEIPNDDSVRAAHHRRSAEFFLQYFSDRLPLLSNKRMAQVVAFTIECHGLTWEEMQNRPEFSKDETLDGQPTRPCVLALLLRIGDLLDLDSDRTSDLCLKHCASWYGTPEAAEHNDRHHHVRHFFYNDKRIEVEVECPTRTQYNIWFTWLEYLRVDIERANTYVFYDSLSVFRLPVPNLKCVPSKDAKFELWPLRFEIDESGALWDVISKSIYTGKHDYLRELIQNSIDACLRRMYEDPGSTLPAPAPRSWSLANYKPAILVVVSRHKDKLVVSDNGIGMDRHIIKEFLFRVAGSGMKKSSADRPFRFPSIATFGVGFISVLTRASKLRLITRKVDKTEAGDQGNGICVQLDANLRDAIVEKAFDCPAGTSVVLKARDQQYLKGMEEFLINTFRYQSAEIHFIDWNKIDSAVNSIRKYQVPVDLELYQAAERRLQEQPGDIEGILLDTVKFMDAARKGINAENGRIRTENAEHRDGVQTPLIPEAGNPVITIRALEPETVPINSAWYFSLGDSSDIEEGRSLKTITHNVGLYAKLIMVPVQFTDHALGVEWRSLHSFLISRGILTKKVFFVRSSRIPSRMVTMPSDEFTDPDYYDRISEQLQGSEDRPYDLVEDMEIRHERWWHGNPESRGPRRIVLVSNRHGIKRYVDVRFDEVDSRARSRDADAEDFFESQFPLVNSDATEALGWYGGKRQAVYQDGIRLPIQLSDIAPVGTVAGVANLVADARLSYNVSRSAIDESEDKLRVWRSNIGMHILKKVAASVTEALDHMPVDYEWKDLWTGEKDGSLSRFGPWMILNQ